MSTLMYAVFLFVMTMVFFYNTVKYAYAMLYIASKYLLCKRTVTLSLKRINEKGIPVYTDGETEYNISTYKSKQVNAVRAKIGSGKVLLPEDNGALALSVIIFITLCAITTKSLQSTLITYISYLNKL